MCAKTFAPRLCTIFGDPSALVPTPSVFFITLYIIIYTVAFHRRSGAFSYHYHPRPMVIRRPTFCSSWGAIIYYYITLGINNILTCYYTPPPSISAIRVIYKNIKIWWLKEVNIKNHIIQRWRVLNVGALLAWLPSIMIYPDAFCIANTRNEK